MAKAVKVLCDRCECKLIGGMPFCRQCGYPTRWATHEERTAWEVAQWKTADRSHAPKASTKESRRWNPFARKAEPKPALTVVRSERPKTVASPAASTTAASATTTVDAPTVATTSEPAPAIAAAVDPAPARVVAPVTAAPRPERIASRVKPVVRAKSAPAPAPAVAPSVASGPRDAQPLTDTPATVMAMRLLNARVAELDEKIQRLERELQGTPQIRRSQ